MTRKRVLETDQGIRGEVTVEIYDHLQRRLRDKGWMETDAVIQSGITTGAALELGPGPGYLGLEWLKHTEGTRLTGLDISANMIADARRNALAYGFSARTAYVAGSGARMPFNNNTFDAAFSSRSLHEWSNVSQTIEEIWRVLKPGGRVFLSDLRRDMSTPVKWYMWLRTKPKAIRPDFITSINAALTPTELKALISDSRFMRFAVSSSPMGLQVVATK